MNVLALGGILVIAILAYFLLQATVFDNTSRLSGLRRSRRESDDPEVDITVKDLLKKNWKWLALLFVVVTALSSFHMVQPGYRGVIITLGSVEDYVLPEGFNFKLPWQNVIDMKVTLEMEQVIELTGTKDLQEVEAELAVHFNIMPSMANDVYKNMRKNYHSLLLKPVIREDLKATTAQFTAEELITMRSMVVIRLEDKLRESLEPYGINVQTINIEEFTFSPKFALAIEAKVIAEQEALQAKNELERIRWEQEQAVVKSEATARMKVIQAEAQRNATITEEIGLSEAVRIAADAKAYEIMARQNATAEGISMVTQSITEQYVRYLYMLEWNGDLPDVLAGVSGTDILLLLEP